MQNKGLIKFFAILFALVSIYQLSFTFVSIDELFWSLSLAKFDTSVASFWHNCRIHDIVAFNRQWSVLMIVSLYN
jgi:hypothetical protein